MFSGALLGVAEREVVMEEFLTGEEVSFFALCDGKHAIALASAQDHKRIGEGDTGPNTGGMGAYTTDTLLAPEMRDWLITNVAQRVVDEMRREDAPFRGMLFCGMMMVPAGPDEPRGTVRPMVLEFNTRFGDPETQAILLRLETDLVDIFEAAIDGTADQLAIRLRPGASVCVIAASEGYPGKHVAGVPITGLDAVPASDELQVFHSGTAIRGEETVTAGGRVLGVAAAGANLHEALDRAYRAMERIHFAGMQYRRDIGWRALPGRNAEEHGGEQ
jgi:phosphoribosylamine--glycine ligase